MLAGPASRAACTTFARPSAKSNSSLLSTLTTGKSAESAAFLRITPSIAVQLADSVVSPVGRVNHGDSLPALDSCLDLCKSADDLAGFCRHGQRLGETPDHEDIRIVSEGFGDVKVALEAFGENAAPNCIGDRGVRQRNPQTAAGKFSFQVGNYLARRRDNKPDQIIDA